MSDRFRMTLIHENLRPVFHKAVDKTPLGYVLEIRPQTRSDEANARFHAAVRSVARACPEWAGVTFSEEDWKRFFVAVVYGQKVVPGPDGSGVIVLNRKTSRMTKPEMSDLIDAVYAFGAERGVEFPVS